MVLGALSFSPALLEKVSQMQQLYLNIMDGVWGTSTLLADETIPPNTTGAFLFPYSWPKKRNIKKMQKTFPSLNFSFWAVWKQVCLLGNTGIVSLRLTHASQPCHPVLHEQAIVQEILIQMPSFQEPNGVSSIILD